MCGGPGRICVLLQDNPDPDALASAAGLRELVHAHLKKRVHIGYGGMCGRAENRAMMDVLHIDAHRMKESDLADYAVIGLVDTQPDSGNNIYPAKREAGFVIDHHLLPKRKRWKARFADVRPEYGATSTLVYEYLAASGVKLSDNLATALFYGIQSDTQDLGREATPAGARAYGELFNRADKKKLSRIRRAPVPAEYFQMLQDSLRTCVVARSCVISFIPDCHNIDMIAEVADLLMRLEGMRSAVCYGVLDGEVHMSARAADARSNMAKKLKQVVAGIGTGGGHRVMAGGQIPLTDQPERRLNLLHQRVVRYFGGEQEPEPLTHATEDNGGVPLPPTLVEETKKDG